jgi:hypothetical protein
MFSFATAPLWSFGRVSAEFRISTLHKRRVGGRIDRYYLVVHFRIIHVAFEKVDRAGVYVKGNHGCIVNNVPGINDLDQGTVVCVPDGSRLRNLGGNSLPGGPRIIIRSGAKFKRACVEYDIPLRVQVSRPGGKRGELELSRKFSPSSAATLESLTSVKIYQTFFLVPASVPRYSGKVIVPWAASTVPDLSN